MKRILNSVFIFLSLLLLSLHSPAHAACTSSPTGDLPGWGPTVTLSSCNKTISTVTGVDYASSEASTTNTSALTLSGTSSLTINTGGHLTVGSLVVSPGTSISIASGGEIKLNTPLYAPDADGDGWATSAVDAVTLSTATASGKRRLSLMKGWTADCGDSSFAESNVCCAANGAACASDGACCGSICGTDSDADLLFSASAGHTGTCQASAYAYTDTNDAEYCPTGGNPAGTCNKCSNGAIANQTGSEDLFSECGLISCSGYYYGWVSNTCYTAANVSAANATCNGSGSCDTAASACPSSSQGSSSGVSRTTCKTMIGCTGTTAGSLGNVTTGTDTYNDCSSTYSPSSTSIFPGDGASTCQSYCSGLGTYQTGQCQSGLCQITTYSCTIKPNSGGAAGTYAQYTSSACGAWTATAGSCSTSIGGTACGTACSGSTCPRQAYCTCN